MVHCHVWLAEAKSPLSPPKKKLSKSGREWLGTHGKVAGPWLDGLPNIYDPGNLDGSGMCGPKLVVKPSIAFNCNDTNEDQKGECDKDNTQRLSGDARDMADMFLMRQRWWWWWCMVEYVMNAIDLCSCVYFMMEFIVVCVLSMLTSFIILKYMNFSTLDVLSGETLPWENPAQPKHGWSAHGSTPFVHPNTLIDTDNDGPCGWLPDIPSGKLSYRKWPIYSWFTY